MFKKFLIAGTVAFVLALGAVVPAAKADTLSDLMAQIVALQAQIAAMKGGAAAPAAGHMFNVDLTVGSTGAEVVALQNWLSANGYLTMPAGVAMGNFGQLTKSAVAAYQAKVGITPAAGYFGPATRAKINATVAMTPATPVVTPVTPVTPATPATPVVGGKEGNLKNIDSVSGTDDQIKEGESNIKVLGVEVEADKSDMTISRLDVDFEKTSGGDTSKRLNKYFTSVSVWADGKKLSSQDVSDASEDNDVYSFRFTGLNYKVSEGDKASIYVAVSAVSDIDTGNEGATWTVSIPQDGIRSIDQAGIADTYVSSSESTTLTEDFTADGLTGVELKVARSSADQDAHTVEVDDQNDTNGVTALVFKVTAKESDIKINDIPVVISTTSASQVGVRVSEIAKKASLWKGSTRLDDASITATDGPVTVTFQDLNLKLKRDDVVELTVKLDLNDTTSTSGDFQSGDGLNVQLTSTEVDAIDAEDSNGDTLSSSELTGTALGENIAFYSDGLVVKLVSAVSSIGNHSDTNLNSVGTYTIKFTVSAFGSDAYIASTTGTSTTAGIRFNIYGDTYTGLRTSSLSSTADQQSGNAYLVSDGSTETFTLDVRLDNYNASGTGVGFFGVDLAGIHFDDSNSQAIATYSELTAGLSDLKTGINTKIYLAK